MRAQRGDHGVDICGNLLSGAAVARLVVDFDGNNRRIVGISASCVAITVLGEHSHIALLGSNSLGIAMYLAFIEPIAVCAIGVGVPFRVSVAEIGLSS